jgi:hypothetical protein
MTYRDANEYILLNVGINIDQYTATSEYVVFNVDSNQPEPFIMGASPLKARPTDISTVYFTGAGATQEEYNTFLQGQDRYGDWIDLPVTRWEVIPASADAYTANREISYDMSTVDPEHTEVDFVVPDWADPPDLPLRIWVSDNV